MLARKKAQRRIMAYSQERGKIAGNCFEPKHEKRKKRKEKRLMMRNQE
jgi:hypothetical protein